MLDDLPLLAPLLSAGIDRLHSLGIKTNLITSPALHNAAFDEFNDEFD